MSMSQIDQMLASALKGKFQATHSNNAGTDSDTSSKWSSPESPDLSSSEPRAVRPSRQNHVFGMETRH
jgi:hypothetical protein